MVVEDSEQLEELRLAAIRKKLTPQELANTAWAYATLAAKDPALLKAVRRATLKHRWEFNPRYLANTSWALATLVVDDSEQREAVKPASIMRVRESLYVRGQALLGLSRRWRWTTLSRWMRCGVSRPCTSGSSPRKVWQTPPGTW